MGAVAEKEMPQEEKPKKERDQTADKRCETPTNFSLTRNSRKIAPVSSPVAISSGSIAPLEQEKSVLESGCAHIEHETSVFRSGYEQLQQEDDPIKTSYMQAAKEKSPVPVLQRDSENSEVKSGEKSLALENGRKITESMIRLIFSPYGEIVDIELVEDQSSLSKGLCFVRYSKRESAIDVKMHKNEVVMRGKGIRVDLSLDHNDLFFGILRKEWSSHQIDQLIRKAFRDVVSVDSGMDLVPKISSRFKRCSNRGFAFVHFSSHEAAAHVYHIGSHPDFTLDGDLHPSIEWNLHQAEFDLAKMAKSKIAYVGNLPPAANEEYLRNLFGLIGKVEKIVLSKKIFGMVGFLHFATRTDFDRAIEEMNGRIIGAPDGGPPFALTVEVARIPAEGKVHTGGGVIKAQIKSLNISSKRHDYSPDAPASKARRVDKMVTGIDSLPPVLKERLLRVFHLRIATEHDIDLHCVNGLKELPESSAISVLDQFLISGADKHDKRSFINSLVAEKRNSWSASSSSPHQSDCLLRVPLAEEHRHYTRSHMSSFSPVSAERGQIRH